MDIRLKKRKTIISFVIFFLSVSMMLANGALVLKRMMAVSKWREYGFSQLFEQDFQKTREFRRFIQGRLSDFIAMASEGEIGSYYDLDGFYWGNNSTTDITNSVQIQTKDISSEQPKTADVSERAWYDSSKTKTEYAADAKAYHESIRENKNLLYRIYNSSRLLYSNMDGIAWNKRDQKLPEGYNFLMIFDGKKVTIQKDGKQLDVYGDGYYRSREQWYVPGYKNFALDEKAEKIEIIMLAAEDPVYYSYVKYGQGGYRRTENQLYQIAKEVRQNHKELLLGMIGLAAGILLFAASFLLRKEKKAADTKIAQFMGKIWFEVKLAALLLFVVVLHGIVGQTETEVIFGDAAVTYQETEAVEFSGLNLIEESAESVETSAWKFSGEYFLSCLKAVVLDPFSLVICFWLIYLLVIDLRKNRRYFFDGLIHRFVCHARTDGLKQPFAVQQTRMFVFLAALCIFYAAAVLILAVFIYRFSGFAELILTMSVLTVLFLLVFLRFLKRTKQQSLELDLLADYIQAVQGGDYSVWGRRVSEDSSLKHLFDSISQIRQGMEHAVGEQIKSERMKVELVANVSHDLKTPLTSIIGYIAFLKQEENLPEHVRDYIRILDEKAERLNCIVQDVFTVSKAASGQLPVELKELDFGKLLRQTLADMEEQIQAAPVTIKTEIVSERVLIVADGNRLYRVFQNLIQNALKYSLEGSRVFIDLRRAGKSAVASIKNISRQELRTGADFTERFVRGDMSRTDAGAGLGLSIAKSFTEACGGEFMLETNADLFVVKVVFPCRT